MEDTHPPARLSLTHSPLTLFNLNPPKRFVEVQVPGGTKDIAEVGTSFLMRPGLSTFASKRGEFIGLVDTGDPTLSLVRAKTGPLHSVHMVSLANVSRSQQAINSMAFDDAKDVLYLCIAADLFAIDISTGKTLRTVAHFGLLDDATGAVYFDPAARIYYHGLQNDSGSRTAIVAVDVDSGKFTTTDIDFIPVSWTAAPNL